MIANTAVWVVAVVAGSIVVSLALAQLVDARFPGRRLVRLALIVPWAAALVMSSKLFVWIYDYYFGIWNHVLTSTGAARAAGGLARRRRDRDAAP